MIKAELIEKMAKDAKITKVAARAVLQSFMDGITKALKKRNGKVTLVGFGIFKKVYRKTRKGRDPQTGKQIKIKGRNVITFKAGKSLRDKILFMRGEGMCRSDDNIDNIFAANSEENRLQLGSRIVLR